MPEHCRTCQRALDSRWAWEDGRPVRVVACPRCARVGRIHAGQRFGAVFQHRGPDRLGEQDGQRVVADGGVPDDRYQQCEMPDCSNTVPKAKGICDECVMTDGGQRVVADGGVTADQLTECWCCNYYTERGALCKDCQDAGCDHFGDSCEVDS